MEVTFESGSYSYLHVLEQVEDLNGMLPARIIIDEEDCGVQSEPMTADSLADFVEHYIVDGEGDRVTFEMISD